MKIALDVAPLSNQNLLLHRFRGVGFYINNLLGALKKYAPQNQYILIQNKDEILDADVVHVPYFEPYFLSLPNLREKTVVTIHDLTPLVFPKNFPSGIKGRIKWEIQKRRLKRMNAIITDSKKSKEDVVRFIGILEDKVHVIYLAAGEEFKIKKMNNRQKSAIKKKYNLPENFFLYVGDATWNKNLPRIIEACDKANVSLVMVGKALKGEMTDEENPWNRDLKKVKDMISKNSNISALGFVETSDLVSLYNIAIALLMPSIYEGFGLPIIEAMRCGCPVITSKEGSIPEIGGEAVYYVDAYNSEDISKAILRMDKEQNLVKELSRKGLIQSEKFSWKKTALQTANVYNSI